MVQPPKILLSILCMNYGGPSNVAGDYLSQLTYQNAECYTEAARELGRELGVLVFWVSGVGIEDL